MGVLILRPTVTQVLRLASLCFLLAGNWSVISSTERAVVLPSTIRFYAKGGSIEVMSGVRTLSVAWNKGEVFLHLSLPPALESTFLSTSIGAVAVSADGEYIFIGTNGGDGLYRYSKATQTWSTRRPLEASTSISAMTVSSTGQIFIGTGGYAGDTEDDASGLFSSTDNGETWTSVPFNHQLGSAPGIQALAVDLSGTIAFVGRGIPGTAQSGVYIKPASIDWQVTGLGGATDIEFGEPFLYIQKDNLVWKIDVTKLPDAKIKPLASTTGCVGIDKWIGDTILVHQRVSNSFSDKISLLSDTILVPVVLTSEILPSKEAPIIKAVSPISNSLVVLGGGRNVFVDLTNNSAQAVNFETDRPYVDKHLWSRLLSWMHVVKQGWFEIDVEGRATKMSIEHDIILDRSNSNFQTIHSNAVFTFSGRNILKISSHQIDTILVLEDLTINTLSLYNDSTILISIQDRIISFPLNGSAPDTMSMMGWPSYNHLGDDTFLDVGAVLPFEGRIFGWANGSYFPVDHYELGGLFEYVSGKWSKVDAGVFGRRTAFVDAKTFGSTAIFVACEYFSGAKASSPTIGGISQSHREVVKISDEPSVIPTVASSLVWDQAWLWQTTYAVMWHVNEDLSRSQTTKYGQCTQMSWLGSSLLLATEQRGVILIDADDLTTDIKSSTVVASGRDQLTIAPIPVSSYGGLSIAVSGCAMLHDVFSIHSAAGESLYHHTPVLSYGQQFGDVITLEKVQLVSGLKLITLRGNSCSHSQVFIVE